MYERACACWWCLLSATETRSILFVTETWHSSSTSVGICQCLGPMNRSNLNSHLAEGDPFWCWGQQPARDCVWDHWDHEVLLKPCSLASLAQLMLCIPFLASPVSFVGELCQPRMQTSSLPHKKWGFGMTLPQQRVPTREDASLIPFGMDFNSFWDLARDRGPCYLHLYQAEAWTAWPTPFSCWNQGNLKNLKHISGCLNYLLSV